MKQRAGHMAQTISNEGLAFLASHEGIVPAPYKDSVGVWTWGVGHTTAAGSPNPATLQKAMPADLDTAIRKVLRAFRMDVVKYESGVRRAFNVPLTQAQFDAAVSFHFNTGAIARASWVRDFNRGDKAAAIKGIMNWKKPPEIIPRRKAERDLFANGTYGNSKVTVWGTNGAGKVIWKPVRTLTQERLLSLMGTPTPPDVEPIDPTPDRPTTGIAALIAAIIGFF
ncbi:MAG TPA: hypothetical protein DCX29_01615, partial [Hyphomonas sp.]|nr:hypothetical protein [Hyphomonas sp.]